VSSPTLLVTRQFEIRGPDWQVSFQRRVFDANDTVRSPNRGALPYFLKGAPPEERLIVVPLFDEEELWVAVTCGRLDAVSGKTADGDLLRVSEVCVVAPQAVLMSIDAVWRMGRAYAIDHNSVTIAHSARKLRTTLVVTITAEHGTETLRIALASPRLYAQVSGRPAPQPSVPEHAYAGWRLP
jgi:hypothetical protein